MSAAYQYHRPKSVTGVLELIGRLGEDAHLMAGGTSLVLMMRQGLVRPKHVIALRHVQELRGISADADGGLRIGALATHNEAERSPLVRALCPALADAFAHVATVRIRNQATVGGNLVHADPAQDPPPMLLALDAVIRLRSAAGERTLPLSEFFRDVFETALAPGELLCEIIVPAPPAGARAIYVKFLPRTEDDYATVSVAVVLAVDSRGTCSHVRIALGAAGPTAFRAFTAERSLVGRLLTSATVAEAAALAAEAAEPIDDLRGSAAYKREMARVWTRRAIESLVSGGV